MKSNQIKTLNLEYVNCNLCKADNSELFFTENGFNVQKCKNCGLVYVNPRPGQHHHSLKYSYLDDRYKEYIDNYTLNFQEQFLKANRLLNEVEKIKSNKGQLLEIGCASGHLLKVAQDRGWQVSGVEPIAGLSTYGREKWGINIAAASIDDAILPDGYFDVIIAINVLSHLTDPMAFFFKVHDKLKKDGLFVFETGNKGALSSKQKGEILGEGWITPEHLYHYSEKTLLEYAGKTGFILDRIIKYHVVDIALLEENLMTRRKSSIKWYIKKMMIQSPFARELCRATLKGWYVGIQRADACSLLVFAHEA